MTASLPSPVPPSLQDDRPDFAEVIHKLRQGRPASVGRPCLLRLYPARSLTRSAVLPRAPFIFPLAGRFLRPGWAPARPRRRADALPTHFVIAKSCSPTKPHFLSFHPQASITAAVCLLRLTCCQLGCHSNTTRTQHSFPPIPRHSQVASFFISYVLVCCMHCPCKYGADLQRETGIQGKGALARQIIRIPVFNSMFLTRLPKLPMVCACRPPAFGWARRLLAPARQWLAPSQHARPPWG